jgi:hypothetical protein
VTLAYKEGSLTAMLVRCAGAEAHRLASRIVLRRCTQAFPIGLNVLYSFRGPLWIDRGGRIRYTLVMTAIGVTAASSRAELGFRHAVTPDQVVGALKITENRRRRISPVLDRGLTSYENCSDHSPK